MAKKTTKKVDVKAVAKNKVMEGITDYLRSSGYEVFTDSASFGFTKGTIVVRTANTDIQLKPITPKAGITRYEQELEDDDEGNEED